MSDERIEHPTGGCPCTWASACPSDFVVHCLYLGEHVEGAYAKVANLEAELAQKTEALRLIRGTFRDRKRGLTLTGWECSVIERTCDAALAAVPAADPAAGETG